MDNCYRIIAPLEPMKATHSPAKSGIGVRVLKRRVMQIDASGCNFQYLALGWSGCNEILRFALRYVCSRLKVQWALSSAR
jgi:hypothetical protein